MKKGRLVNKYLLNLFTKISEFIFEKQQRCKDGSRVPPSEVHGGLFTKQ
jgi:hypothetical protein